MSLRRLYTTAGCEMGEPGAAHLIPDTLTLPDLSSDALTISSCDRYFSIFHWFFIDFSWVFPLKPEIQWRHYPVLIRSLIRGVATGGLVSVG